MKAITGIGLIVIGVFLLVVTLPFAYIFSNVSPSVEWWATLVILSPIIGVIAIIIGFAGWVGAIIQKYTN